MGLPKSRRLLATAHVTEALEWFAVPQNWNRL